MLELSVSDKCGVVPLFSKVENDCGLVCGAMLLQYYGCPVDANDLEKYCAVKSDGLDMKALCFSINNYLPKFNVEKYTPIEFDIIKLPAIVHLSVGHFVILRGVGPKLVLINDPSLGEVYMERVDFQAAFSGYAVTTRE